MLRLNEQFRLCPGIVDGEGLAVAEDYSAAIQNESYVMVRGWMTRSCPILEYLVNAQRYLGVERAFGRG